MFPVDIDGMRLKLNHLDLTAHILSINSKENVLIPRSVIYESREYIITAFDYNVFSRNIHTVRFSEDSEIKDIPILHSTSVISISLPPKLDTILSNRFKYTQNLKEIIFPPNSQLKYIKRGGFRSYLSKSLHFPSTVETIEEGWCEFTPNLIDVTFKSLNEFRNFDILENNMMVSRMTNQTYDSIIFVPRNMNGKVKIPSFVKKIGDHSFNNCKCIESIEFSEDGQNLTIGSWAFAFSRLKKVFIPSSVTEIKERAFYSCVNLSSLEFSEDSRVKSIDGSCFYNCKIRSVIIPKSFEKFSLVDAFPNCDILTSVEFLSEKIELIKIHENAVIISFPNAKKILFPWRHSLKKEVFIFVNHSATINHTF